MSVPVTYQSLKNKDIDVFLGNWMPTHGSRRQALHRRQDRSRWLSQNLEGANYTLVVPDYVYDGGIKSLADIGKFKDKLDGKIYGIEPGNDGNRIMLDMIATRTIGLDGFELVESSEEGMLSQAEKAMKGKELDRVPRLDPAPA